MSTFDIDSIVERKIFLCSELFVSYIMSFFFGKSVIDPMTWFGFIAYVLSFTIDFLRGWYCTPYYQEMLHLLQRLTFQEDPRTEYSFPHFF